MRALSHLALYIFAFVGFAATIASAGIYYFVNSQSDAVNSMAPLEEKYEPALSPLETNAIINGSRSENINVTSVIVREETPEHTVLEVTYDTDDSAPLDNVWIGAHLLEQSGAVMTTAYKPGKAHVGMGRTARVWIGLADTEEKPLVVSERLLIKFYEAGGSPFHEEQFAYQRVWCRGESVLSDLVRGTFTNERTSKYAATSQRTVSRLCLGD
ncbi:hypothetical protein [Gilvimarinus xylanilyticus]|uniref:Uncharacterized protein n=1 Tax=Gilvimarinus xylanilyticus TaxID=2944139 RepID=A0A9X2KTY0_9GAMM|nr:hypothetical protein [Gilvimarinus xylanilyticus]MCP8899667.1 hypothetical protein [Gilvimarinus xylanilyticus]